MKLLPGVLFLLFLCLSIVSCQKKSVPVQSTQTTPSDTANKPVVDSTVKVKKEKRRVFPDVNKFKAFYESNVDDSATGNPPVELRIREDKIILDSLTIQVYRANKNSAFWNDSARCHHIIRLLENSHFDGLLPQDYAIPELDSLFDLCFLDKKKKSDTLFWNLELQVTKNFLRYLNHLRFGKTNPEAIFKDWDYKRDVHLPYTPTEFAELFIRNPDTLLSEMRPQYPLYNVLRSVLYTVDTIAHKSFEWDAIPYIGKDLKLGDTAAVLVKVKHRLQSVGLVREDTLTEIFDADLLAALKYFQQQ
jgi:L,D-transpeptidase YcbB